MDLHVRFGRLPQEVTMVAVTLDQGRSDVLQANGIEVEPADNAGECLWVALRAGTQVPAELPELNDVAELTEGGVEQWAVFIGRYGLLEYDPDWLKAFLSQEYILRVPIGALQGTAIKAQILVAAEEAAALGRAEAFGRLRIPLRTLMNTVFREAVAIVPEGAIVEVARAREGFVRPESVFHYIVEQRRMHLRPPIWISDQPPAYGRVPEAAPDDLGHRARLVIAWALEDAVAQMEADAFVEPDGRGVPEHWGFNARGCWPLVVLREFVHRDQYYYDVLHPRRCGAVDCERPIPSSKRKYCSRRCREREKARRRRHGQRVR